MVARCFRFGVVIRALVRCNLAHVLRPGLGPGLVHMLARHDHGNVFAFRKILAVQLRLLESIAATEGKQQDRESEQECHYEHEVQEGANRLLVVRAVRPLRLGIACRRACLNIQSQHQCQ